MPRPSATLATALLTAAAAALAGCSSPSTEDAAAAYCASLESVQGELTSLVELVKGDATVSEVQDQRDAVSAAIDAAAEDAAELDDAVRTDAEDASGAFDDAVSAIPGDATVSEAAGAYQTAADGYLTSLSSIAETAGCS